MPHELDYVEVCMPGQEQETVLWLHQIHGTEGCYYLNEMAIIHKIK